MPAVNPGGGNPLPNANANAAPAPNANANANPAAANQPRTDDLQRAFTRQYNYNPLVNADAGRANLSDALKDMGNILGIRQQRLSEIAVAIAKDASSRGSFNPIALQQMTIESQTNEQWSQLQKKIFDHMSGAVTTWVR